MPALSDEALGTGQCGHFRPAVMSKRLAADLHDVDRKDRTDESAGGEFKVQSTPGRGTVMTVEVSKKGDSHG